MYVDPAVTVVSWRMRTLPPPKQTLCELHKQITIETNQKDHLRFTVGSHDSLESMYVFIDMSVVYVLPLVDAATLEHHLSI